MRTPRSMTFGSYHTHADGLWTLTSWSFEAPAQKQNIIEVPGSSKLLDLSTSLTDGEPTYGSRELVATFESSEGSRMEREARIDQMVNTLDGHRMNIVLPDDQQRFLLGRVSVKKLYNDPAHASVQVTAVCEPWRYAKDETVVVFQATVDEQEGALVNQGRLGVVPTLDVADGDVNLSFGDRSWTLGPGTYHLPDLYLKTGENPIRYSGIVTTNTIIPAGRMRGDVDGDGVITALDVTAIINHRNGSAVLTDETQLSCADINGDGTINTSDQSITNAVANGAQKYGRYATDITNTWSANPNYATEEAQFYTDITVEGATPTSTMLVAIVKNEVMNATFVRAESLAGAVRIYATAVPIAELDAVVTCTAGGTGGATVELVDRADTDIGGAGGDTLTWDGDTTGLEVFEYEFSHYKVSDVSITKEDIANGGSVGVYIDYPEKEDVHSVFPYDSFAVGDLAPGVFVILAEVASLMVVTSDYSEDGFTLKQGVYFSHSAYDNGDVMYISSFTINGYTGFGGGGGGGSGVLTATYREAIL